MFQAHERELVEDAAMYPRLLIEDRIMRWIVKNPRKFLASLSGVIFGTPLLIGIGLGAWIF